MSNEKFKKVPAWALTCASGSVELAAAADHKGKTSPVRLKARSGQPIEHGFWGKIVHDLAGMRLHKSRLPIDYAHNDDEVLGYLNKFDASTGDLIASGALIPFKADDRASEVLHKMREGVPYEASIFFGGDGIKVQEVAEGEMAEVNGYRLDGPAVIVREWPLRGVAICPYGADMNTESAVNFAKGKEFAVEILEKTQESKTMDESKQAEAAQEAVPETVPEELIAPVEAKDLEAEAAPAPEAEKPAEEAPAVEAEAPAADPVEEKPSEEEKKPEEPAPAVPVEQKPEEDARSRCIDEFCIMEREFGPDIAAATFKAGGTFRDAEVSFYRKLREDNVALKAEVAEARKQLADQGGKPTEFAQSETKKTSCLFKTGK